MVTYAQGIDPYEICIERVAEGSTKSRDSIRHALPGPPPNRAAVYIRLFSLKHFNLARGIRCEKALPPAVFP